MRQFIAKLFWPIWATIVLVGCGVPGVPKPPSLDLPQPVSDLRAVRKGDRVYLIWTTPSETTDHLPIRHMGATRVCRSLDAAMNECANSVGEVLASQLPAAGSRPAKPAAQVPANYTDNLPPRLLLEKPGAKISYAVSVLNANGRNAGLSNSVQVPAVAALPPPANFRAQTTAEGIVVSWTGIPNAQQIPGLRYLYRVYRRPQTGDTDTVAAEIPLDSAAAIQFVDHAFEWEGTYFYRAAVATVIHEEGKPETQFEGDDTPVVTVFAHDVFPPAVPSGLQAVFSGAGQPPFIDLIWAPDTDADLIGYNVFRHEAGAEPVKINSGLVKTSAFRDLNVASGKTYFFSVSAVDARGNESARSQETSEAVP